MISDIKESALQEKIPIIQDGGLLFLLGLIVENEYKEILELGTAVAYSAINMALLDDEIHIDTIEKDDRMYEQAARNIGEQGLSDQIKVYHMPIEEFRTDKMYDLIFVDAAKAQYGKYLEQFIGNLKDDGKMVFDNMIFHGLIYETERIGSRNLRNLVKKIRLFRENMQNDERFDIMLFDNIGDGILLLSRRKDET
jgi:predicted O-methyltransferase YrrM